MKKLLTILFLIALLQLEAQRLPASFYKSLGAYRLPEGQVVMIGLLEENPVIIFSDGRIRGLRDKGPGFEIGNSLGRFDRVEGNLSMNKKTKSIQLVMDGKSIEAQRMNIQQEEVSFTNGEVKLSGALVLPEGSGPFPCLIMTHGSGPERKEASLGLAGLFASSGIAAFIYDKRFVRERGDKWEDDSFENYAQDAIAAAGAVSKFASVDVSRIGIFGHSQGGWVAPLAVSKSSIFKFLIISAGNVVTPVEQHLWMGTKAFIQNGGTEAVAQEIYEFRKIKYEAGITGDSTKYNAAMRIVRSKPWFNKTGGDLPTNKFWKLNGYYDARPALSSVACPVLVIAGESDNHSNTKVNMVKFQEVFSQNGNTAVTYKVFQKANHAYLETETGRFYESELKDLTRFVPGYFETLTGWVKETASR